MSARLVVLPGDSVETSELPTGPKRKLIHGLRQFPNSNTAISVIAGPLEVDQKRKTARISTPNARYIPKVGDSVIAQVRGASFEQFHLYINPYSAQAILSHFAFEGASKKTRPQLKTGDLVYAKVIFCRKDADLELSCVNPDTGKADGLGPLDGGCLFNISLGLSDRLLRKELTSAFAELGSRIPGGFELVVGKNGRVWVDCAEAGIKGVVAVGRVLQLIDEGGLVGDEKMQKKALNRSIKDLGFG